MEESMKKHNVVLIIDESQNLKAQVLEQIRLLSNLETEKEKLLQIVLVGQPELNSRLQLHGLRQLNQRIMVRYHISPLENLEITDYIYHRLKVAGSTRVHFTDEALLEVAQFSCGIPRLINILCDRALLAGFTAEVNIIDDVVIEQCIEELQNISMAEQV